MKTAERVQKVENFPPCEIAGCAHKAKYMLTTDGGRVKVCTEHSSTEAGEERVAFCKPASHERAKEIVRLVQVASESLDSAAELLRPLSSTSEMLSDEERVLLEKLEERSRQLERLLEHARDVFEDEEAA